MCSMTCIQCQQETSNPRFCGRSCAAKYNNARSPKRSPEGSCSDCGASIPTSRKRCGECRLTKSSIPTKPKVVSTEEGTIKQQAYLRKRRNEAKVLLGGKCTICGSVEKLEFDHVDPREKCYEISRGIARHTSWEVLLLELAKCQLLCKSCHLKKSVEEGSFRKHAKKPVCGESSGYNRGKCKCDACRAWKKASRTSERV